MKIVTKIGYWTSRLIDDDDKWVWSANSTVSAEKAEQNLLKSARWELRNIERRLKHKSFGEQEEERHRLLQREYNTIREFLKRMDSKVVKDHKTISETEV